MQSIDNLIEYIHESMTHCKIIVVHYGIYLKRSTFQIIVVVNEIGGVELELEHSISVLIVFGIIKYLDLKLSYNFKSLNLSIL